MAVDHEPWSLATYAYHRPELSLGKEVVEANLAEIEPARLEDVDVLLAGVPCQPFSRANRQRRADDPRSRLFMAIFSWAAAVRPRVIVVENVSGFQRVDSEVRTLFRETGYEVASVVLDATDAGVAQHRTRLFLIGFSAEHFPDAALRANAVVASLGARRASRPVTLMEAIGDLPPLDPSRTAYSPHWESVETGLALTSWSPRAQSSYARELAPSVVPKVLLNHKSRFNNDRDIEIFGRLQPGEDSRSPAIRDLMPYRNRDHVFADKYYKLRGDRPSRTITAHMRYDCNSYIHPNQPRGLTVREAARVQGFPDVHAFLGTFQRLYQQVGNSVPPRLARFIAEVVGDELAVPVRSRRAAS